MRITGGKRINVLVLIFGLLFHTNIFYRARCGDAGLGEGTQYNSGFFLCFSGFPGIYVAEQRILGGASFGRAAAHARTYIYGTTYKPPGCKSWRIDSVVGS